MHIVADLHIHSHYSRATSKNLDFEHLTQWAQLKGVDVVGTGDIAHPGWLAEMREKLEEAEDGLFRLREEFAEPIRREVPSACQADVRFLLAGEISNIYKKGDKTRKVHNVIFAPTLDAVERIQTELEKIGNIRSDGRPILGLDSRNLLEIILTVDERCHLIPAHIWTPWFSMLGSKSGFDTVEECFDDLTDHIFAVETGLSSDPPMNWRVSMLDRYTLVSNSDAHSPPKLAREATLFNTEPSYDALFAAMRSGDPETFRGTIEFFPEEGKYHYDGHRKCDICWHPQTSLRHEGLCSVCGKPVTMGVMHRVEMLADRPLDGAPERRHPFHSLIPLPEMLSELHGVGSKSKRVQRDYVRLLGLLGSELDILLRLPLDEIATVGGEVLAAGIGRMRRGEINAQPGYDGEYGVVKVMEPVAQDEDEDGGQLDLFGQPSPPSTGAGEPESNAVPPPAASTPAASTPAEKEPITQTAGTTAPPETPAKSQSNEQSEPRTDPPPQMMAHHPEPNGHPAMRPNGTLNIPQTGPVLTFTALPLFPGEAPKVEVKLRKPARPRKHPQLEGLNGEQREAVRCVDAPLIIVAGPGTGKTRTLTRRIAYLVDAMEIAPETILAITFTNKAAEEMRERIADLLNATKAEAITVKTFHAFGALLLQEFGQHVGLAAEFTILGEEDRGLIARRCFPEESTGELNELLAQISEAKNELLTPDSRQLAERFGAAFPAQYRTYQEALEAQQALDFDDLMLRSVTLLQDHDDVRQQVQARYRWISVDEYQDINRAQDRLLRLLTAPHPQEGAANLCVIGDPDQAIYGFRGADRGYFLRFEQDYPGAQVRRLRQNYRSTQMILEAAQNVMSGEPDREALEIFSEFVDETKLDTYVAPTGRAEAEYVVHQIEQMIGGTSYFSLDSGRVDDEDVRAYSFADFAVLYRTGAQSHALMEAFDRSGMPYQAVGQTPLYARKEVRNILDALWLLHNPRSLLHLERVLTASGVSFQANCLDALHAEIAAAEAPWRWLRDAGARTALRENQRRRLHSVVTLLAGLQTERGTEPVTHLIERVQQWAAQDASGETVSQERMQQLQRRASAFGTSLRGFLESTALQSESDFYDPNADRISLMTLHAAKGLEFPVVFMVGCEEGILPFRRAGTEKCDVDEERRLFYVGMTRAQRRLMLLRARQRFLLGQAMENPPSRFLHDIERALLNVRAATQRPRKREKPTNVQLSLFE